MNTTVLKCVTFTIDIQVCDKLCLSDDLRFQLDKAKFKEKLTIDQVVTKNALKSTSYLIFIWFLCLFFSICNLLSDMQVHQCLFVLDLGAEFYVLLFYLDSVLTISDLHYITVGISLLSLWPCNPRDFPREFSNHEYGFKNIEEDAVFLGLSLRIFAGRSILSLI